MDVKDNLTTGYIKIHRSLIRHWLWQPGNEVKLKWWLSILIEVNHTSKKVNIGYGLVECNRGQSIKSLGSWAKEWLVTKKTVVHFFNLLEQDQMIIKESLGTSTRLTVCNYERYQQTGNSEFLENSLCRPKSDQKGTRPNEYESESYSEEVHAKETANTREVNAKGTQTSNYNNVKKEIGTRKQEFYESVAEFVKDYPKTMLRAFYDYWSEMNKTGKKMRWELQETFEVSKRLAIWAKRDNEFITPKNKDNGFSPSGPPLEQIN